jgi:hypothetical protein
MCISKVQTMLWNNNATCIFKSYHPIFTNKFISSLSGYHKFLFFVLSAPHEEENLLGFILARF